MNDSLVMKPLVDALLVGDHAKAVAETRRLRAAGVGSEEIVTEGIEAAMEAMDEKCTVQEFNLLEIMLAGRAASMVTKELFPEGPPPMVHKGTVVLAALEGDVHDLGKNILKMILSGRGYNVVDCGVDCPLDSLIQAVLEESAIAVYVSGLITSVVPAVKRIRKALSVKGLSHIKIVAGGAALRQLSSETLNVDFVAQTAFDGAHYLDKLTRDRP